MRKLVALTVIIMTVWSSKAQNVINKTINGQTYTVTQVFPGEIMGTYTYEGNGGHPKVELKEDGTGYFEPHGTPPVKINFWIDCEPNGEWRKQVGGNGRYQYTLVIQYQEGGTSKNYEFGKYDLMGVTVVTDLGRVVIYGERYKPL